MSQSNNASELEENLRLALIDINSNGVVLDDRYCADLVGVALTLSKMLPQGHSLLNRSKVDLYAFTAGVLHFASLLDFYPYDLADNLCWLLWTDEEIKKFKAKCINSYNSYDSSTHQYQDGDAYLDKIFKELELLHYQWKKIQDNKPLIISKYSKRLRSILHAEEMVLAKLDSKEFDDEYLEYLKKYIVEKFGLLALMYCYE